MEFQIFTLAQKPHLEDKLNVLRAKAWKKFMQPYATEFYNLSYRKFPDYQILLCDSNDRVAALGTTVLGVWDGTLEGLPSEFDRVLENAEKIYEDKQTANVLTALAVVVDEEYRGKGYSVRILRAMKELAAARSLDSLIVPVRPTLKSTYPITPATEYIQWNRSDGTPFDPWVRTHHKLGGRLLDVPPVIVNFEAKIADWEEWTDIKFPVSGQYVIPGALCPIDIDLEQNLGTYREPNFWMKHSIQTD